MKFKLFAEKNSKRNDTVDIILETVVDYLKKPKVNSAILIDGDWGSGKTYYWKNILKQEAENAVKGKSNSDNESSIKYISLYGLSSIAEVERAILYEFVNIKAIKKNRLKNNINIDIGKFAVNIFKNVAKGTANFYGFGNSELKLDFGELINLQNIAICFDDLERTTIDFEETLGYINNLIEHQGVKVILLANQKEIGLEKFEKVKEKIIGKTLYFEPNLDSIYSNLLKTPEMINIQLKKDLLKNKNSVLEIFANSSANNLRILKQAMSDLESIYNIAGEDLIQKLGEEYRTSLIVFAISLSFALKTQVISSNFFDSISKNEDFDKKIVEEKLIKRVRKGDVSSLTAILEFYEEFLSAYKIQRNFFKCVELLICKGKLDRNVITNEIEDIIAHQENIPKEIDMVLELEKVPDNNLESVINKTLQSVKNADADVFKYSQSLEVILRLVDENIIPHNEDDVYQCFLDGLKNHELMNRERLSTRVINSISNSDKEKIKSFNSLLKDTLCKLEKERNKQLRLDILESAFHENKRKYFLQEFFRQPFDFSEIPFSPEIFFEEALCRFSKIELLSFSSSLRARNEKYEIEKVYEKPWLIELGKNIEIYLNSSVEKKLTHMYLKEILTTIEVITDS